MTSHSDYHTYGFNTDEIFAFLAKNGFALNVETSERGPAEAAPKWPPEYILFPSFDKYEAALILCGIIPDEVNEQDVWEYPRPELTRKLKLIESYAKDIIALDPDFEFNQHQGKSRNSAEIYGGEKISQAVWRKWCDSVGLVWPIPERSNNLPATPSTDAELLAKWKQAQIDLAGAGQQIEILKTQLREAQNAIDDLRRTAGDKDAIAPYNTHLMKIAIQVQRNYWKDLTTPPKQETLCAELVDGYKLSRAEAQAVERVACPIDRKK